jgi:hypothetical protein
LLQHLLDLRVGILNALHVGQPLLWRTAVNLQLELGAQLRKLFGRDCSAA